LAPLFLLNRELLATSAASSGLNILLVHDVRILRIRVGFGAKLVVGYN